MRAPRLAAALQQAALRRRGGRAACYTTGAPRVVRTDSEQCVPWLVGELRARGCEVVELPEVGTTEAALAEACRGAAVLLHCYTPVTPAVFAAGAPTLRAVVKYGVGVDKIDFAAAKAHKVAVANVPEYGEETVAEGAFHLLIALAKKSKLVQRDMQGVSSWAWPTEETLGNDLAGKSLGLLGLGRIGRCMARMAGEGFRMRLLSYDPNVPAEIMARYRVERVSSVAELCRRSDAISVHCTLNEGSAGVLGESEIAQLPRHALVVNVSRGEIADERALAAAVLSGRLGGLGADVFGIEPLSRAQSHPFAELVERPDCIFTPHLAFWTAESRQRLEREALARCVEALEGRPLRVLSADPRLLAQDPGIVTFGGHSIASGRWVDSPASSNAL
eukprot:TRINITY_DN61018_c0_g1_i1.p1 TRINITY_DN61018_c0_g1~~TRINITY_DN61018_c0_g1_i1.p1  ORF type:complete len:415 (+),score=102.11 TRINITY_DN61018_c0_g1_i1:76-1245(+)